MGFGFSVDSLDLTEVGPAATDTSTCAATTVNQPRITPLPSSPCAPHITVSTAASICSHPGSIQGEDTWKSSTDGSSSQSAGSKADSDSGVPAKWRHVGELLNVHTTVGAPFAEDIAVGAPLAQHTPVTASSRPSTVMSELFTTTGSNGRSNSVETAGSRIGKNRYSAQQP